MPLSRIVMLSNSLCNTANIITKYQIVLWREKFFECILAICERNIFHYLGGDDSTLEAYFWDKFISGIRSLRSLCVNKWGSFEEQLALNVGSQSALPTSCCPWFWSESELSSLTVRFSGGFRTGYSSLCCTGLIADGKSGYFTVSLDLEVIPIMFVKQRQQSVEVSCGSLQTLETANGIWREPFTHPLRSLTQGTQQIWGAKLLSWSPTLHPKWSSKHSVVSGIKMSPLRFEGHFTKHVTDGVRMIYALPWHDENIINAVLLHKTLN